MIDIVKAGNFKVLFAGDGTYSILEKCKSTHFFTVKVEKLSYQESIEYLQYVNEKAA